MTVEIDSSAGFCWGVVRTIRIAEETQAEGTELVTLGDIIHNPKEIQRLRDLGIEPTDHETLEEIGTDTRVLIRAHGEPQNTYRTARDLGLEVIDATCPVVTKLQERIRKYDDNGYQIVIFGKKEHAEVVGLRGVCRDECVVIRTVEEARECVDLSRKTVLFSQTTMGKTTFSEIRSFLEDRVQDLLVDTMESVATEFHAKDTICGQVSGREQKLREFASRHDVMLFVAGRKSSNGKVLHEICRDENPRTYFIEDESEILPEWFEGASSVGISGATSTPQWLMTIVKQAVEYKHTEVVEITE